jgi:DNA-binding NtrC family response regulator
LIVDEVAELDANDQRFLLGWLNGPGGRTQVISLTSQPLFPLVERGLFLADLYYRLNIVRPEVGLSVRAGR